MVADVWCERYVTGERLVIPLYNMSGVGITDLVVSCDEKREGLRFHKRIGMY